MVSFLKKVQFKRRSSVCQWRRVQFGSVNSLAKRVEWGGLGVREKYVQCLVIVVIFMELGRAKRWERGEVLKSSYGG